MPARGPLQSQPVPASTRVPRDFPPVVGSDFEKVRNLGSVQKKISRCVPEPLSQHVCELQHQGGNRQTTPRGGKGRVQRETIPEATWQTASQRQLPLALL